MLRWWTDAICARSAQTFKTMPLLYKLAEISIVLAPVAVTWSAYLQTKDEFTRKLYGATALLLWLTLILQATIYIRGDRTLRRDVQPSARPRESSISSCRSGA